MRIIQLDLPILKEYNTPDIVTDAHCGKATENDLSFVFDFLSHNDIGLSDEKPTMEDVFCFTVFIDGNTHIVGVLCLNDKQIDFQKFGIPNSPINRERIFHSIEYLICDKSLLDETFLQHAILTVLHSIVNKEDKREEVLWFEYGNNLYSRLIDKYQKQYGYYFVPEAEYFSKAIIAAFNKGTSRYNELLNKVK